MGDKPDLLTTYKKHVASMNTELDSMILAAKSGSLASGREAESVCASSNQMPMTLWARVSADLTAGHPD